MANHVILIEPRPVCLVQLSIDTLLQTSLELCRRRDCIDCEAPPSNGDVLFIRFVQKVIGVHFEGELIQTIIFQGALGETDDVTKPILLGEFSDFVPDFNPLGYDIDGSQTTDVPLPRGSFDEIQIQSFSESFTGLSGDVDLDGIVCQSDRDEIETVLGAIINETTDPAYKPRADLIFDGTIDQLDLTRFDELFGQLPDCNENGVPDACDIADGTSPDLNGDGIPDECECPWDLDGSGAVGTADLVDLLSQWGDNPDGPPDFDGSGSVGTSDLLKLLSNWGPCP